MRAMAVSDVEKPRDYPILIRGQNSRRGDPAERTFLTILGNHPLNEGSGRKQLAEALVSPENPLTARVLINRVWDWHFGQPLVNTPSDFGVQTAAPLQLELLDYLANWFLTEGGQSLKNLHRHLLTSQAYQLSSAHPNPQADPENLYFTRANRKRLPFEAMRDSVLAASDSLKLDLGGRPVTWTSPQADERRSVLRVHRPLPARYDVGYVRFPQPGFAQPEAL